MAKYFFFLYGCIRAVTLINKRPYIEALLQVASGAALIERLPRLYSHAPDKPRPVPSRQDTEPLYGNKTRKHGLELRRGDRLDLYTCHSVLALLHPGLVPRYACHDTGLAAASGEQKYSNKQLAACASGDS